MILTLRQILELNIMETPLSDEQKRPCAIDVCTDKEYSIEPKQYIQARTNDVVSMPSNVVATLYPRSSTHRRGITLDMTGLIDPGFHGSLSMPLVNNTEETIVLAKGERIASLVFQFTSEAVEVVKSQYHEEK